MEDESDTESRRSPSHHLIVDSEEKPVAEDGSGRDVSVGWLGGKVYVGKQNKLIVWKS